MSHLVLSLLLVSCALVTASPASKHVAGAGVPDARFGAPDDTAIVLPEGDEQSDNEAVIDSVLVQSNEPTAIDQILPTPENDQVPEQLSNEMRIRTSEAFTKNGRDDMKAKPTDPLDGDCDSPQLGEVPAPHGIHMNQVQTKSMSDLMKEQEIATRQVLMDNKDFTRPTLDDPSAGESNVTSIFTQPIEIDEAFRAESLPKPDSETEKKSKCTRFVGGHEVPDPLRALDDECGMPEAEELKKIELAPPPLPQAELMPPIPAGEQGPVRPQYANVSIEFVDFGVTRRVSVHVDQTVGHAIELAGIELGVRAWTVQLARSGGVDVPINYLIHDIPDRNQLIVYLICSPREHAAKLIMTVPNCEDLTVRNFTARVEIPAYHEVHDLRAYSTDRVSTLIARIPSLKSIALEKITYDGQDVEMNTPLEILYFRDRSAFVVYPKEPCPSHTPSPSLSPSASISISSSPSISPLPVPSSETRKLGAYDAYRHCKNARGEKVQLPDPNSLGLDPAAADPTGKSTNDDVECEGTEMTEEEEHDFSNTGSVRQLSEAPHVDDPPARYPMTQDTIVLVHFNDREFPVLLKPTSKGIDIFDAVERASGKVHFHMVAKFLDHTITHYTPLKPLGFLNGDHVYVLNPKQPRPDDGYHVLESNRH